MEPAKCAGCGAVDANEAQSAPKDKETIASPKAPTKFKTVCAFLKNGTCSKTLMTVLDRHFETNLKVEELSTDPLAGGMMQGYQCGMLWGSALAAGAQAHRLHGAGPEAEAAAMRAAQRLATALQCQLDNIDCGDITETNPQNKWQTLMYHFVKGGVVRCAGRMANFAPLAFEEINIGLSEDRPEGTCAPASCAAELARKMGASEEHATMAAGLAGGIGFTGSGCGALGAAIWLLGINGHAKGLPNKSINAQIGELMERFLEISSFEYECAEIVGRKFEGIDDHAGYLQQGGCAKLIEALAAATEAVQDHLATPVTEEGVVPAGHTPVA